MSFSAIWTRRLKYMLSPQFDLYARIRERFCLTATYTMGPILDYGCGIGFGSVQLILHADQEGCEVIGIDSDPEAVGFAKEALGNLATFYLADAVGTIGAEEWSVLKLKEYGLITLIEVIEHMEPSKQYELVRELSSAMDDSGALILSTPNKHSQWRKHSGHIGMHDTQSLCALLEPIFADIRIEDYLGEPVAAGTSISPLVAVCRDPK